MKLSKLLRAILIIIAITIFIKSEAHSATKQIFIDVPEIGSVLEETILYEGIKYIFYKIPEEINFTDEEGKPKIAYLIKPLNIPKEATNLRVEVLNSEYDERSGVIMYPVPKKVLKEKDGLKYIDEEFYKDEAAYQNDMFYPTQGQIARVEELGFQGDDRLVNVVIYPIQYNPGQKVVRIYRILKICLSYDVVE